MEKNQKKSKGRAAEIRDYAISIGIAIAIAFLFRSYVFARANVDGPSMMSTLKDKDVIFVEKLSLYSKSIKRGEIVTFDSGNPTHDTYVKRVIGIAGDDLEIKDGNVYRNGEKLKESYLNPGMKTLGGSFLGVNKKYKVPEGYIFVMGDNRTVSLDSRYLGPISLKALNGHVILRAYPFNTMKIF
ncbi:signal peptidase I [Clostridium sp. DMHC 10]|uniref:signal peptidase I n=1 Tax=Clostridium sp. DMHC 10 TaxID=747377 RepID=UPI00069DBF2C|nr:signal peptidase I [Clostridium sp. DMHC 10]KOF55808.1 signal peptidase I [Clostridium sp. DMHC 10]